MDQHKHTIDKEFTKTKIEQLFCLYAQLNIKNENGSQC
jgi:hypothetical protein